MSKIDESDALQANVRTMQIIVAAMGVGVVFFWVLVTAVLRDGKGPAKPEVLGLPLITALSMAFGLASVVGSIFVPRVVAEGAIAAIAKGVTPDQTRLQDSGERAIDPSSDAAKLLPVYQTQLIIASALNEGAAFFAGIAYMLDGHAVAVLVGGVLIALLLSRFPTIDRVRGWLDAQLERLAIKRRDDF